MENDMRILCTLALASLGLASPALADNSHVAGTTLVAVSYSELREVARGWSAKHAILGQKVYNEKNERVGSVDDLIVTKDRAVTYVIINAGPLLGVVKHDVAVPVSSMKLVGNKLVLAGVTADALRDSPTFEYAN
jgi:sporulation protein YlmC with PRC-barrel domain